MTLARCPCGEVPTSLHTYELTEQIWLLDGGCCKDWRVPIGFKKSWKQIPPEDVMAQCEAAWNAAPRKK